jgi:hypothetical protein
MVGRRRKKKKKKLVVRLVGIDEDYSRVAYFPSSIILQLSFP